MADADIVLAKKINGNIVNFYPKTRSDLVMYDESKNITEKLNEIIASMQEITTKLDNLETKIQDLESNVVKVPASDLQ